MPYNPPTSAPSLQTSTLCASPVCRVARSTPSSLANLASQLGNRTTWHPSNLISQRQPFALCLDHHVPPILQLPEQDGVDKRLFDSGMNQPRHRPRAESAVV